MTPVKKPAPIPSGVIKCVGLADERFLLVVVLDGIPFKDVGTNSERTFKPALADWRRATLPTLARSSPRFFYATRGKELAITEVAF
jgi:hypothetical protein